jgi:hypothetical protein
MSDEDFAAYLDKRVSIGELVDKYNKQNRLDVRLRWPITPSSLLTIDTTIYDIDYGGGVTITKILDAVMSEDGAAYIPTFVHEIFDAIPDLSPGQRKEIDDYLEKARKLAELGAKI